MESVTNLKWLYICSYKKGKSSVPAAFLLVLLLSKPYLKHVCKSSQHNAAMGCIEISSYFVNGSIALKALKLFL